MNLDDLRLFVRVAELGTLSSVARERDVAVSQISRTMSQLEAHCGVQLLRRTTHGLSLTAEGEVFLGYCRNIAQTLDELDGEFTSRARNVRGVVRVAVSANMAQHVLVPSLPALVARHPGLTIELQVSDALVDMSRDGIDIAIRTGSTQTEEVIARQIGSHGRRLYASPAYLKKHGKPKHPDDLAKHRIITTSTAPRLNDWPFVIDGKMVVRPTHGQLRASSTAITQEMALAGLGICRVHDLIAAPLVRRGELVEVLARFTDQQVVPVYAMMLPERHRLPKIRACVDFWAEWLPQFSDSQQ
ncbi:LysR family transcriptional regulator [Casimicrobium huifangae]|uniref:LysR family transcriptional regulator n=1 Tax=Casimicrobium huifangae TaxID=2591109 RepID=UPI0012EBAF92|nr:LysR family transcriptional regulator [Casimicrobium huifangae]